MFDFDVYKIGFNITSPISFFPNELPVFDSILSWCSYLKNKKENNDIHTPHGGEVNQDEIEIPIIKDKLGFYYASRMFFDKNKAVEGVDSWKKRWENKHDDIVDFGKAKKRINTGSGQFKSYNVPVIFNSIKKVWFYFGSYDVAEVDLLVSKYLNGIGKKVSIGFGWFDNHDIIKVDKNNLEISSVLIRPLPIDYLKKNRHIFNNLIDNFTLKTKISTGNLTPPYWKKSMNEKIMTIELKNKK